MKPNDRRARLARQARAVIRLCGNTPPRQRITAMAVAGAHGDDPGAVVALQIGGADALATLLNMRRAAKHPAMQALQQQQGMPR